MPAQSLKKSPHATQRDVLNAPPSMVAEIIGGTLDAHPRPAMRHAFARSSLGYDHSRPFQFGRGGPGGWCIIDEPELHFGREIVVPDLAGWRRETMPGCPDAAYCTIAPDWIREVLSPTTCKFDLHEWRQFYASENVNHLWLVDPVGRDLEAFELRDGHWLLIAALKDDDQVSVRPLEDITFNLAGLWPEISLIHCACRW